MSKDLGLMEKLDVPGVQVKAQKNWDVLVIDGQRAVDVFAEHIPSALQPFIAATRES